MVERFISRGFRGRRQPCELTGRIPPGQHLESGFPVLSAGPTPRTPPDRWDFWIVGTVTQPKRWTWDELQALSQEPVTADVHCVTRWTKLDTHWKGVSVQTLLEQVAYPESVRYVITFCDGGYTTNLPLADVLGNKAWVVFNYEGKPIAPERGGPARLLVPHLYFWKSAKWVCGLQLVEQDQPGFWESLGYHNDGDPWKEQRYWGD
jgi:DMSO/TMAO reductase YedYZ molybdopterin-dependent catalytic subunit